MAREVPLYRIEAFSPHISTYFCLWVHQIFQQKTIATIFSGSCDLGIWPAPRVEQIHFWHTCGVTQRKVFCAVSSPCLLAVVFCALRDSRCLSQSGKAAEGHSWFGQPPQVGEILVSPCLVLGVPRQKRPCMWRADPATRICSGNVPPEGTFPWSHPMDPPTHPPRWPEVGLELQKAAQGWADPQAGPQSGGTPFVTHSQPQSHRSRSRM